MAKLESDQSTISTRDFLKVSAVLGTATAGAMVLKDAADGFKRTKNLVQTGANGLIELSRRFDALIADLIPKVNELAKIIQPDFFLTENPDGTHDFSFILNKKLFPSDENSAPFTQVTMHGIDLEDARNFVGIFGGRLKQPAQTAGSLFQRLKEGGIFLTENGQDYYEQPIKKVSNADDIVDKLTLRHRVGAALIQMCGVPFAPAVGEKLLQTETTEISTPTGMITVTRTEQPNTPTPRVIIVTNTAEPSKTPTPSRTPTLTMTPTETPTPTETRVATYSWETNFDTDGLANFSADKQTTGGKYELVDDPTNSNKGKVLHLYQTQVTPMENGEKLLRIYPTIDFGKYREPPYDATITFFLPSGISPPIDKPGTDQWFVLWNGFDLKRTVGDAKTRDTSGVFISPRKYGYQRGASGYMVDFRTFDSKHKSFKPSYNNTNPELKFDQWHQVFITCAKDGVMTVFLDGIPTASGRTPNDVKPGISAIHGPLYCGNFDFNQGPAQIYVKEMSVRFYS